MPLTMLQAGRFGKVREVRGGRGFTHRLAEMGILPGTEIRVVKSGGPVILEAGGNRLVVGRGMAHRIIVEPLA